MLWSLYECTVTMLRICISWCVVVEIKAYHHKITNCFSSEALTKKYVESYHSGIQKGFDFGKGIYR